MTGFDKLNPWHPMSDPVELKTLGKFIEELGEGTQAAGRCLIQGMDEREPETNKPNRLWLQEEIADILANIDLVIECFGLNGDAIFERGHAKKERLREWHRMA